MSGRWFLKVLPVAMYGGCLEHHVFDSADIPPADDTRCVCGAVTWKQEVERKFAALRKQPGADSEAAD